MTNLSPDKFKPINNNPKLVKKINFIIGIYTYFFSKTQFLAFINAPSHGETSSFLSNG